MQLLKNLKRPKDLGIMLAAAAVLFYANYYAMAHLPGTNGYACIMGAALNPLNIGFGLVLSLTTGTLLAGFLEVQKNKWALRSIPIGSTSLIGVVVGTLTAFCTLCTIPVISLFGFGVSIGFITDYEIYFKILSLAMLGGAAYMVNKQLLQQCGCAVKHKS